MEVKLSGRRIGEVVSADDVGSITGVEVIMDPDEYCAYLVASALSGSACVTQTQKDIEALVLNATEIAHETMRRLAHIGIFPYDDRMTYEPYEERGAQRTIALKGIEQEEKK